MKTTEAKNEKDGSQQVADWRQIGKAHIVGIFAQAPRQMDDCIAEYHEQDGLRLKTKIQK